MKPATIAAALLLAACGSSARPDTPATTTGGYTGPPTTEWVTDPQGGGRCLIVTPERPWSTPRSVSCYPIGTR